MRRRGRPTTPIDDQWEHLRNAILQIQNKNSSGLSFEQLYRYAHNMVLQKLDERIYVGTEQLVREHVSQICNEVIANFNNTPMTYLNTCWKDHHTAMVLIRNVLMYMDREGAPPKNHPSVYETGISVFYELVIQHPTIRDHLRRTLLDMIEQERRGGSIPRSEIRDTCQMYVQLGMGTLSVYVNEFENLFLEQSKEFYAAKSEALLSQSTSSRTYIREIDKYIEDEKSRVKHYLDSSTESNIVELLEEELISRHLDAILAVENSGLADMLKNDGFNDIAAMCKLVTRVSEGPGKMAECISSHLEVTGQIFNQDKNISDSIEYISHLINLRKQADKWLTLALDDNSIFRNKINHGFTNVVNSNNRSPELLSLFIHQQLTRGTRGLSDQDLDADSDMCIVLFRYLQDKDIFERYYKKHLARRLLGNESQSDDHENRMIGKLQVECGTGYTGPLEDMLKDMEISKTLMEEFNKAHPNIGLDLNVRVLTSGRWPISNAASNEQLPLELSDAFNTFREFYLTKHNGRRLNVENSEGRAELSFKSYASSSKADGSESGRVATRRYILEVSTGQMIILMAFNRYNQFTFTELTNATNMSGAILKRHLIPLIKDNKGLLLKKPPGGPFKKDDVFSINESFSSKHRKITIKNLPVKETSEERDIMLHHVDEDRKYTIDAAIVRVMKLRKTLTHNLLVNELVSQLKSRFKLQVALIKQRIESLIDREFLARSDEDRTLYVYVT